MPIRDTQTLVKKAARELVLLLFLVFVAPALQAMAQADRRNVTRPVVLNVYQPVKRRTRHLERHYVTGDYTTSYRMIAVS